MSEEGGGPQPQYLFFFGTSAELFKILPVLRKLQPAAITLVYTGQQIIEGLDALIDGLNTLHLFNRPLEIARSQKNLWRWMLLAPVRTGRLLSEQRKTRQSMPSVVVHGDTLTALMSSILAKLHGGKLFHIEAGLRSNHDLHPFPEELIRKAVSWAADVHFAPGSLPAKNLASHRGEVVNTHFNTSTEASFTVVESQPGSEVPPSSFALVSLHRYELFRNIGQMQVTARELRELSSHLPLVLVVDSMASAGFKRTGTSHLLMSRNVQVLPKMAIGKFHYLLRRCTFLITDSGGQQEEAFAFGIPTLIHRKHTERSDGIGWNARLGGWEKGSLLDFFSEYEDFKKPMCELGPVTPSSIIADRLSLGA